MKIKKNIKKFSIQKGFSIVEFLLYAGIFSIFLLVLTELFLAVLDLEVESQATSSVAQDSRFIMARMTYDISHAQTITTPATLGQSSSSLVLVVNAVPYTYSLTGASLQLTDGYGTQSLNSFDSSVTNLNFERLGNSGGKHAVKIGFTITSNTKRKGVVESKNVETMVGLR